MLVTWLLLSCMQMITHFKTDVRTWITLTCRTYICWAGNKSIYAFTLITTVCCHKLRTTAVRNTVIRTCTNWCCSSGGSCSGGSRPGWSCSGGSRSSGSRSWKKVIDRYNTKWISWLLENKLLEMWVFVMVRLTRNQTRTTLGILYYWDNVHGDCLLIEWYLMRTLSFSVWRNHSLVHPVTAYLCWWLEVRPQCVRVTRRDTPYASVCQW